MEDNLLADKQLEVLRRRDRIAEKAKEILSVMSKYPLPQEGTEADHLKVKQLVLDICNDLGAIGTIAGGKVANKMNDVIATINRNMVLIDGLAPAMYLEIIYLEPMLREIVGFAIKFDKGRPIDVKVDVEPLTGKFGGHFSRGK